MSDKYLHLWPNNNQVWFLGLGSSYSRLCLFIPLLLSQPRKAVVFFQGRSNEPAYCPFYTDWMLILLIVPSRALKQKACPSFTLTRWGCRLQLARFFISELTGMENTMIPCCLQLQQKQTSWHASPAGLSQWGAKTYRSQAVWSCCLIVSGPILQN